LPNGDVTRASAIYANRWVICVNQNAARAMRDGLRVCERRERTRSAQRMANVVHAAEPAARRYPHQPTHPDQELRFISATVHNAHATFRRMPNRCGENRQARWWAAGSAREYAARKGGAGGVAAGGRR